MLEREEGAAGRRFIRSDVIGTMLLVSAAAAALTAAVAALASEWRLLGVFVGVGVAGAGAGWLLRRRSVPEYDTLPGGLHASVALGWLLVAALGALPFWLAAGAESAPPILGRPVDALFESMSGFTSTGLSVVSRPDALPWSLQWWRSLSQWIGGIGIALLAIALLDPAHDGSRILVTEVNKPFARDPRRVARWIGWIYAALTVIAIAAFAAQGMPAWEALNHGMTAAATGGFAVTRDSFGAYSRPIQASAMVVMMVSAISFAAHYAAIRERSLRPYARATVATLLAAFVVATLLLILDQTSGDPDATWADAAFQAASGLATGGFSTVKISEWSGSAQLLLVVCMTVGGISGATTGGIKIDRALWIARGVAWRLRRQLTHTEGDDDGEVEGRLQVEAAATLAAVWAMSLAGGTLLLTPVVPESTRFSEVLFEVASALGSVGLSTGIAGPELPASGKLTLIGLMWLGRLEIFAVLALFVSPVAAWRRRG